MASNIVPGNIDATFPKAGQDNSSQGFRDNFNEIKYHEIQPEKGMMIVMPTKTLHGTYPQPRGLRHTLNLDFGVKHDN